MSVRRRERERVGECLGHGGGGRGEERGEILTGSIQPRIEIMKSERERTSEREGGRILIKNNTHGHIERKPISSSPRSPPRQIKQVVG